jgi:hypothetical protein
VFAQEPKQAAFRRNVVEADIICVNLRLSAVHLGFDVKFGYR